ncbi:MAG: hypothetical protein ACOYL8_05190 [Patescibacteria group bacterium]
MKINIKKHKTLLTVLGVIAFLVLLSISGRYLNKNADSNMIFFYGDTCPHCKNVEEYITANNIKAKVNFKELETYNNTANANLLADKAQKCGLDTTGGVPVPLFFDGQNCIVGDVPIIEFLKTK